MLVKQTVISLVSNRFDTEARQLENKVSGVIDVVNPPLASSDLFYIYNFILNSACFS